MNLSATTQPTSSGDQSEDYDGDGTTLHLPTSVQPDESWYHGAIVGTKSPGKNTHVVYPDYSALYPSTMLTINVSPDTLIGTPEDLRASEYDESDCINGFIDTRPVKRCDDDEDYNDFTDAEYKAVFKGGSKKWSDDPEYTKCYYLRPDVKHGFITDIVADFIEVKNESKGTHLYSATKAVVNSVYGTLGYSTEHNTFRLFDYRLAETVSLMGRKFLRLAMETFVGYAQTEYDTDAYVTHYDTDGAGVSLDVDSREEALTIAHDAAKYLRDVAVPRFLKRQCGYDDDLIEHHTMEADIEYYAPSVYNHNASKRYAKWVTNDEGENVDEVSVTGFECIRSDVANVTVDVQTKVFDLILRNDLTDVKEELYEYVSETITAVENGDVPIEDLGVRGGIGQPLEQYGSANRRPQPIYRGALWARDNVPGEDSLGEASKPMKFPVKHITDDSVPHQYQRGAQEGDVVDTVAVEDPRNIEDIVVVDREKVARKQIRDRVEPIIENIDGWSWTELQMGHSSSSLDQFM